ncbi:MAG: sulfite exporter TauE/SafE family protein [Nanoarchaeota archaeon]
MITGWLIFLLAGIVTGIVTGLVGASAIVIFVPIILLFFDYSLFVLIGISLAVDVFVALFAWIVYRKFKHIDFKTGFYLSILAIVGAIVGSYFSRFIPNTGLLEAISIFTAITGIMIFRRKVNKKEVCTSNDCPRSKFILAIILSFFVGLLGGGLGPAGGISIFLLLVFFLNFETHRAIGTSVFVMFFIALFGSVAHIYYISSSNFPWILLLFAVVGGIFGSFFSSRFANAIAEKNLNRIVGAILFVLGVLTLVQKLIMN